MRRLVWAGLGMLLGAVGAPAQSTRPPDPVFVLQDPRPNPVLPAALVPFAVAPEVCRRGHTPMVALRVYNVFAQAVASLRLRDRRAVVLDSIPLRCGQYVAIWDGTVAGGTRTASPGVYYLRLVVDDTTTARKVVVAPP